jgi:CheY-like chemotaxis protein
MITKLEQPGRWLVVDDNREILALTCDLIEQLLHVRPVAFTSAAAALGAVQTAACPIELVLTDLEMPNMSGLEFCRQLRRLSPATRIVLMTGSGYVSDDAAAELGFDGLLQKPFCVAKMKAVLAAAQEKSVQHLAAGLLA